MSPVRAGPSLHTSMRGRLTIMIIAILVMPLTLLGLIGLGTLDEQVHAADQEWQHTEGQEVMVRVTHVADRLVTAMRGLALVVALDGARITRDDIVARAPELLAGWGLAGEIDEIVWVDAAGPARAGLDRDARRGLEALAARPGQVGHVALVADGEITPSLYQGIAVPRADAALVLLRRLDDETLRGVHVESATTLLLTLGDRVVAQSHSRRGGPSRDARAERIRVDDWSAIAGEPAVWLHSDARSSSAAVRLQHPDSTAIGSLWMTAELDDGHGRYESVGRRAGVLLGLLAMGGVVMALGVGWVAPHWVARGIRGSTDRMYASVRRLRELGARNARGIHEQTRVIGGLVESFDDLGASSRSISSTATELSQLADQSSHVTRRGEGTVQMAADATARVRERVAHISEHIGHLGQQAVAMRSILDLLQNLTNETNRLSIDATIEATEAGESGRRFRLIAEEIGKLADQGLQSTRVIASRIDMVTESTQTTLDASRAGSQEVDHSLKSFQELEHTFELILSWVEETMNAAREIERRTSEQAQSLDAVAESIEALRHRAGDTETNFRDIAEAIDELAMLADDMNRQWKVG